MCGIVGYIGEKKIDKVLLGALSRLEYRGYDSAGLAAINQGKLSTLRENGKLSALKELAEKNPLAGSLGIGHTRWATHGEPSVRNAHPHRDESGQVAVVHNGIIENFESLKKKLEASGYTFRSETDSEVIAQLIGHYHIHEKKDLATAVRLALQELEGSYAFCVISAEAPDQMIAARNGSPLVVGLGENENLVASDAPALLDFTRDVIFLEDYQMVEVRQNQVTITTTKGEPVSTKVTRIDWDAKDVSKEGFDHFMLKEIEEQPKVLERMIRTRLQGKLGDNLFDILRLEVNEILKTKRILIQACGTSWHAGLTAKFWFEKFADVATEVEVSSEFRYRHLVAAGQDEVVLSITQSGETIDTLMGMRQGRKTGYKALSICNVLGSTIARESDAVIYSHAGPEIGVASTKAYTAQLGILFLLALYLGKAKGKLSAEECESLLTEFRTLPEKMRTLIGRKEQIKNLAKKYAFSSDFLFLGRGLNYPNAHEGALKIKEIAYIHATGHPAGEMKHGPIALIDEHMPVVAIAPASAVHEKMMSNMQEVKARHGQICAIATEGDEAAAALTKDVIFIPKIHELLSPLLAVIPLQYLAYYVAVLRGTDVDQPRNLAKSVTVE